MRPLACIVLAAALLSPACARRDVPYRFRAPVVSSVRAEQLPRGATRPRAGQDAARRPSARPDPARAWLSAPSHAQGTRGAGARVARVTPGPAAGDALAIPQALRARIGTDAPGAGSASFALATLVELGAHLDARVRQATSGAHVLDLARERDAVLAGEPPLTGDLVVLAGEHHGDGDRDLLLGIVVTPAGDDGGPVELVYAEDGTVRHAVLAARACRERERAPASATCLSRDRVRAFLALDRLAP